MDNHKIENELKNYNIEIDKHLDKNSTNNSYYLKKFMPNFYIDIMEDSKILDPNLYLETNQVEYKNIILGHLVKKNHKIYLYYFIFIHDFYNARIINLDHQEKKRKYYYFRKESLNKNVYFNHANVDFNDYYYLYNSGDNILPFDDTIFEYSFYNYNSKYKIINIIGIIYELDHQENINGICILPNIIKDYNKKYKAHKEPYWIRDKSMFPKSHQLNFYISAYTHYPYLIKDNIEKYIGFISFNNDICNKNYKLLYELNELSNYVLETYSNNKSFMNIPKIFFENLDKITIYDIHKLRWKKYVIKSFLGNFIPHYKI